MTLENYAQGRNNNFNFIRIIAAYSVLVTHSFALALGSGDAEPFRNALQMTMGSMAVDVFFVTSGFLVTASLLNRGSVIEFCYARALRILPALIVMLLLCVCVIGVLFTNRSAALYFLSHDTYLFFLKNSLLFLGVSYNLPGVFEEPPTKWPLMDRFGRCLSKSGCTLYWPSHGS